MGERNAHDWGATSLRLQRQAWFRAAPEAAALSMRGVPNESGRYSEVPDLLDEKNAPILRGLLSSFCDDHNYNWRLSYWGGRHRWRLECFGDSWDSVVSEAHVFAKALVTIRGGGR